MATQIMTYPHLCSARRFRPPHYCKIHRNTGFWDTCLDLIISIYYYFLIRSLRTVRFVPFLYPCQLSDQLFSIFAKLHSVSAVSNLSRPSPREKNCPSTLHTTVSISSWRGGCSPLWGGREQGTSKDTTLAYLISKTVTQKVIIK